MANDSDSIVVFSPPPSCATSDYGFLLWSSSLLAKVVVNRLLSDRVLLFTLTSHFCDYFFCVFRVALGSQNLNSFIKIKCSVWVRIRIQGVILDDAMIRIIYGASKQVDLAWFEGITVRGVIQKNMILMELLKFLYFMWVISILINKRRHIYQFVLAIKDFPHVSRINSGWTDLPRQFTRTVNSSPEGSTHDLMPETDALPKR